MKELLIELYVIEAKDTYFLSVEQTRHLLSFILMATLFKTIVTQNMQYKDGKIQSIDGIRFQKHQVIIDPKIQLSICSNEHKSLQQENVGDQPCSPKKKTKMSDNWVKYLKELRKK